MCRRVWQSSSSTIATRIIPFFPFHAQQHGRVSLAPYVYLTFHLRFFVTALWLYCGTIRLGPYAVKWFGSIGRIVRPAGGTAYALPLSRPNDNMDNQTNGSLCLTS